LWFHSPPRLERIHVRQGCDVVGWSKAVEAGEYDVGDHIVTTTYEGRREQFSVAHGFIDDTRVLHFLAYAKDSETRYSSSSVTEALAGDGGIDRRLSVSTTLSFDRAIPIAGEGDCVVSAEYEVLRYERFDERGNELPEAEAEPALASASDPIACSYGPGEYGQEIRAATDFFDEESLPPEVSDKLRERMWIDRLDADVLFMEGWVFRYEVLPQGL
jgi:hypothetical protein